MPSAEQILIRIIAQDETKRGVDSAKGGLGGLTQSLGLGAIGYAAAAGAAVAFAADAVNAAGDAAKATEELRFAYDKFNATHDVTEKSMEALGFTIQNTTRFSREQADASEATLAQFKLTGTQIEHLLPLVADYAAKTGRDLPAASELVGKALLGNTRALKEVGIAYKPTGDAAQDYANIMALLSEKVGGFAEKDAKTLDGSLAQMKNQWQEIQVQAGNALLPIFQALMPAVIQIMQAAQPVIAAIGQAFQFLAPVIVAFYEGPVFFLYTHWNDVENILNTVIGVFEDVAGVIGGAVAGAISSLAGPIGWLIDAFTNVANTLLGPFVSAWNVAADAVSGLIGVMNDAINIANDLADVAHGIGGFLSSLNPFSVDGGAPAAGGGPVAYGVGATGAPGAGTYGTSSASNVTGGGNVNIQVDIHGNVGDPIVIGRRIIEALDTVKRTSGNRHLRALVA